MNKQTHLIFGEIIWKYLNDVYGITLNHSGFLLGNIAPDLTFSFVIHPHERNYAATQVRELIDTAITSGDLMDFDAGFILAERLGSICHYCADFFCEAHTERYEGGLRAHIQYEKNLYHYTKLHQKELGDIMDKPGRFAASDTGDIFRKIEKRNDTYLTGRASYRAQATGALNTCLEAVGTIMTTRYYTALSAERQWAV